MDKDSGSEARISSAPTLESSAAHNESIVVMQGWPQDDAGSVEGASPRTNAAKAEILAEHAFLSAPPSESSDVCNESTTLDGYIQAEAGAIEATPLLRRV